MDSVDGVYFIKDKKKMRSGYIGRSALYVPALSYLYPAIYYKLFDCHRSNRYDFPS